MAPAAAWASCDSLKTSVDAGLQAKKLTGYSLTVADADKPGEGKVVGHCEGGKKVLIYQRAAKPAAAPAEPAKN